MSSVFCSYYNLHGLRCSVHIARTVHKQSAYNVQYFIVSLHNGHSVTFMFGVLNGGHGEAAQHHSQEIILAILVCSDALLKFIIG